MREPGGHHPRPTPRFHETGRDQVEVSPGLSPHDGLTPCLESVGLRHPSRRLGFLKATILAI